MFLCGLLTAHRFPAMFNLHDGLVTLRFDPEERELHAGEAYLLERFMVAEGRTMRMSCWKHTVTRLPPAMGRVRIKPLPVGWCSWSCYYGNVNEEKIRRAADGQATYTRAGESNLIRIDDGWQRCGSFCGKWVPDDTKFPSGLEATGQYVRDRGMTFGLWLAPWLLDDKSDYYGELKHLAREEATLGEHYHPFELGIPDTGASVGYLPGDDRTIRRALLQTGFLGGGDPVFNGRGDFIRFRDGFRMEVLRGALQTIRDAVGPDAFLLLCGAPTLIGAGITDGSRTSADIIWGRNKNNPSYWEIMKNCRQPSRAATSTTAAFTSMTRTASFCAMWIRGTASTAPIPRRSFGRSQSPCPAERCCQ